MTLLVAAVEGAQVWMTADTALDDPKLALRERSFKIKIAPVQGCSLIGFAESAELGPDAIAKASRERPGADTLQLLLAEHRRSAYNRTGAVDFAVEFAYAFLEQRTLLEYLRARISAQAHTRPILQLELGRGGGRLNDAGVKDCRVTPCL